MNLIESADVIGMFCRLNMNLKRELPIRASEMGVLIYISKLGKDVTPLMISQFFKISKPSVTSMVNSLIKHNYLEKIPSSIDKRSYTLRITEIGKNLVESTFVEYYKSIELMKDAMGEENFIQFIQLMNAANSVLGINKS